MNLHWPQITMIALMLFTLAVKAVTHGTVSARPVSFPIAIVDSLIILFLLLAGGFFQ